MTKRVSVPFVIVLVLCGFLSGVSALFVGPPSLLAADPSTDVYFHTPGVPSGPSAPTANDNRFSKRASAPRTRAA